MNVINLLASVIKLSTLIRNCYIWVKKREKSSGSSIILNQQNWLKIVLNYSVLLRVWIIANEKNIYYVFLSHALLLIQQMIVYNTG